MPAAPGSSTLARHAPVEPIHPISFWSDKVLWLVLILGLLLRVGYNLALHPAQLSWQQFIIDEREYFGAAHMLANGRGFAYFDTALWVRPPLYVVALAPLLRFFEVSYLPVLLFQSLLSAFTLVPLAWIGQQLAGRAASRWTALLGALYLPFTLFAGLLLSETLFVFLFACSLPALELARRHMDLGLRKKGPFWIITAGVLVGLCVLTRATALGYVPLAALWLALQASGQLRRRFATAAMFGAVSVLVIMPWVVRNYAHFGRFVGIDTTSGYNLWLGSVGVRDEERLQADLRSIPDPAARQDFAYAQAWGNIRSDPAAFVAKGLKETIDLWKPSFSAEERQVRGYTAGRVPAWHLGALFVLDDLLYFGVLLLAAVGLVVVSPASPFKSLTWLWVGLWCVVSFIFFAVTRFRLPVVAALLPWAGALMAMLTTVTGRKSLRNSSRPAKLGLLGLTLLVALLVLPALPTNDTLLGIQRQGEQSAFRDGEAFLSVGRVDEALSAFQKANKNVPDTRYSLAAAYLQQSNPNEALGQLRPDEPERRFEPFILRGEVARLNGDLATARSLFNDRVVSVAGDEALTWAWNHLRPPSVETIEIGSGLDIGYIRGFYGPESTGKEAFRWTADRPQIRGLTSVMARVSWSGWRPEGKSPAEVASVGSVAGQGLAPFNLPSANTWREDTIRLGTPGAVWSASVNAFIGGGSDPRFLGVRVSRVSADK